MNGMLLEANEDRDYKWKNGRNLKLEISSCKSKKKFLVGEEDVVQILGVNENEFYIAKIIKLLKNNDEKQAEIQWFFLPSELPKHKLKNYNVMKGELFYDMKRKTDLIDAETIIGKCSVDWLPTEKNFNNKLNNAFFFKCGYNGKTIIPLNESLSEVDTKQTNPKKKVLTTRKNVENNVNKSNKLVNLKNNKEIVSVPKKTPAKKDEDLIEKSVLTSPVNASSYGRFDASFVALEMIQDSDEEDEGKENTTKKTTVKNHPEIQINGREIRSSKKLDGNAKPTNKRKSIAVVSKKLENKFDEKVISNPSLRRSSRKVPKLVIPLKKLAKLPQPKFATPKTKGIENESESEYESESSDFEEDFLVTPRTRSARKSISTKTISSTRKSITTPKLNNFKTPQNQNKSTSRRRYGAKSTVTPIVIKMPGNATPYIRARPTPCKSVKNALEKARTLLHVSVTPESLPCREEEFQEVFGFVQGMIESGGGGCMYVSGVPGTGKTATVNEVMENLQAAAADKEIPDFLFAKINGMSLTEPRQAYVQLLQQITGEKVSTNMAAEKLADLFSHRRKQSIVLLADELDLLWTKKQDVMYHLFDWPTNRHARFIVVAVANTMDLPERMLMNRVASRLGLTRLTFKPYTFKQLQEIVASRLQGLDVFEPDAIQLVSRKVAAVSGDARRCLDICRRATEIAEKKSLKRVNIENVHAALQEMFATPMVKAIRSASYQEQMFLRAIVAEFRRLGIEEATLGQITVQHRVLTQLEGLPPISNTTLQMMASNLSTCRLILMEAGRRDLYARIRLNLSVDDVLFALNC